VHVIEPAVSAYVPEGQRSQEAELVVELKLPGSQGAQEVDPSSTAK
jgi:hypothetical protein